MLNPPFISLIKVLILFILKKDSSLLLLINKTLNRLINA
jgi:hypothetical protein